MRRWLAAPAVLALMAALGPGAASALAADCSAYPGDNADRSTLAVWMADGALRRGVPPELPVMGALVESGMKNLNYGDADSAGFFAMRVSIWNRGDYAGFPENPPLQLKWFLDRALAIQLMKLASGDLGYGADENRYGEWAADVLTPAEQYRGRYQLRLGEARALIGSGCPAGTPNPAPGLPAPPPPPGPSPPDTQPPALDLPLARLSSGARGIVLRVVCDEACVITANARISIPGAARVYRLSSPSRTLAPGASARLTLRFGSTLRRALKRMRRRGRKVTAALRVTAVDSAGNATSRRARVRLG
jgi:hypothetical protein